MKKDNNNIFCSVSAGYSSVMMAIKMKEWFPEHNIINVMANTSKERTESLEFMDKCDKYFGLDLVWVEAEFHEYGTAATPKVVKYEDLKVNGEIFEEGIKKYGIPSSINKWCNRDMKINPLTKYADMMFGKNNYSVAVGIRWDEIDRVRNDFSSNNVFYPLIDNKVTQKERNAFWRDQPIKIGIQAFKGNCDLCFEKSNRKLMTILAEESHLGDWWNEMIQKYGSVEMEGKQAYNDLMAKHGGMTFFRKFNTIPDLVEMASKPFSKATDEYVYENDLFDLEGDCGAGCQIF